MNNKTHFNLGQLNEENTRAIAAEVIKHMEEGMTLQEAVGISDTTLEEIYSLAYSFYDQGKYQESISLFQLLAAASPTTYKFVLGLASSYHQMQVYAEAAIGFYIAFNLEPDNPIPAYYATDCFLKQNLFEEADEFAQVTILVCETRPEYQELRERCELIRHSLKTKKH